MSRMSDKFVIGLIQMRSTKDAAENLARAVEKIGEAAKRGAQIVCMDELFRSEYFCRTENAELFNLAETFPGPTTDVLTKVALENKVAIIASLFERRAAGLYHNTCAVIDADGSFLGKYRKMHIPDDPLYYEKFYFTPGDLGFPTFETKYGRIGVQICWDQWYPEGSRAVALGGAQVIFYPTSIGWHPAEKAEFGAAQLDAWKTIQRAHAIANGVYVAAVNRVGFEGARQRPARRRRIRRAIPASNSGEIRLWPTRSGKFSPRRRRIKRKFWSSNAIRRRARTRAAIGRSCATAAWMRTSRSSAAGSGNDATEGPRVLSATYLPHARRMGAARGDLARMAARAHRLAGKIRADTVGVRRDREASGECGARQPAG